MKDATGTDAAKPARDALALAHADLTTATKKAIGDDGKIFFGAASALDVAVECLFPPNGDPELAQQSCREALALVKLTRAYAQRASGGNMAKLLEQVSQRIEDALKLLDPKRLV